MTHTIHPDDEVIVIGAGARDLPDQVSRRPRRDCHRPRRRRRPRWDLVWESLSRGRFDSDKDTYGYSFSRSCSTSGTGKNVSPVSLRTCAT